jgi:uncharacterized protein
MHSLLDPAILFFVFGAIAGKLKSNLEIPAPISKFLSLYLLMALGLKGGFALANSGLTHEVANSLAVGVLLAVVIPCIGYPLLRRIVPGYDAAAIAATYGSVSAVTFITATQYLDRINLDYGGHMAAAMALMESPAIILAIVLTNRLRSAGATSAIGAAGDRTDAQIIDHAASNKSTVSLTKILHESFTDGTQLLLLGAMVIGLITGDAGNLLAPVIFNPLAAGKF